LDPNKNKMIITYSFDLYAEILVHNETENANKTKNLFVPYFIKLLTNKGHTYEHEQIRQTKNAYDKDNLTKDEVLKASDINKSEFNALLTKQFNNLATRDDKIKIERYMIIKDWKLDEITDDFLNKFYGKTHVLFNLRFLLDKSLVSAYLLNSDEKYIIDFDAVHKLEQIEMIEEVIKKLGYKKIGDIKSIDGETFEVNMKTVMSECQLFKNPNKSHPLFSYDKSKISKLETIRQFMGFINSLFSDWGIVIECCKSYIHEKINNKRKTICVPTYVLFYVNDINKYV